MADQLRDEPLPVFVLFFHSLIWSPSCKQHLHRGESKWLNQIQIKERRHGAAADSRPNRHPSVFADCEIERSGRLKKKNGFELRDGKMFAE